MLEEGSAPSFVSTLRRYLGPCLRERRLRSNGRSRGKRTQSLKRPESRAEGNIASVRGPNGWYLGKGMKVAPLLLSSSLALVERSFFAG